MKKFIRSCGILAHPTSFPSPFGIGDLGPSAYDFIDYLEKSGQSLWQILPLGPTSFGDSPYQSFSTFACNPLLISPELLVKQKLLPEEILIDVPEFSSKKVDYGTVIPYKNTLFRQAYNNFIEKNDEKEISSFHSFCKKNQDWLEDFSLFTALKDTFIYQRHHSNSPIEWDAFQKNTKGILSPQMQQDYYYGAVWTSWPEGLPQRMPAALKKWKEKMKKEMEYHQFLQYIFFLQWTKLKQYANQKGIQIIGDIPIFVAYDSTDTWSCPENFYLNTKGYPTQVAGVPPDYFSETGQLWGNPLYRYEHHKKTGFTWWIARIRRMLELVDFIRIDHFRGFDQYWAVPFGDKDARKGEWRSGPGRELFDTIKKELGHLPIIAEDLGVITDSVTKLRNDAGFPGMKILQFAFDGDKSNSYLPHNFQNTNAVVYTGTHDNNTTNGWYETISEKEKDLFRRYLNVNGKSPSWDLIRLAISSIAVFAIYPIQDVLCLDGESRMNTPSTPSGNWQFRYCSSMLKDEDAEALLYLTELFNRIRPKEKEEKETKEDHIEKE